jgi:hypothetical protein
MDLGVGRENIDEILKKDTRIFPFSQTSNECCAVSVYACICFRALALSTVTKTPGDTTKIDRLDVRRLNGDFFRRCVTKGTSLFNGIVANRTFWSDSAMKKRIRYECDELGLTSGGDNRGGAFADYEKVHREYATHCESPRPPPMPTEIPRKILTSDMIGALTRKGLREHADPNRYANVDEVFRCSPGLHALDLSEVTKSYHAFTEPFDPHDTTKRARDLLRDRSRRFDSHVRQNLEGIVRQGTFGLDRRGIILNRVCLFMAEDAQNDDPATSDARVGGRFLDCTKTYGLDEFVRVVATGIIDNDRRDAAFDATTHLRSFVLTEGGRSISLLCNTKTQTFLIYDSHPIHAAHDGTRTDTSKVTEMGNKYALYHTLLSLFDVDAGGMGRYVDIIEVTLTLDDFRIVKEHCALYKLLPR